MLQLTCAFSHSSSLNQFSDGYEKPLFLQYLQMIAIAQGKETHPGCLRATYGTDETRNAVHGSQNREAAEREIRFLFRESKKPFSINKRIDMYGMTKLVSA